MPRFQAFAVCPPGLVPWLAEELTGLGITEPAPAEGGVGFETDLGGIYRANLESGLATQVLVRVAEFGARSLADLDRRGARIDWTQWLRPGTHAVAKASCKRSRIYHSGAAEERIQKHLAQQLGTTGTTDSPAVPSTPEAVATVRVRILDNRCYLSLETSGTPLHRRGWRLEGGKAPLREDLARATILASGWDQCSQVLDPMMGSGTLLIEAACLARRLAPGRLRRFAIENFAMHDAEQLAELRDAAKRRALTELPFRLFGSDRDAGAVEATRHNAERAGVLGDLELRCTSLSACLEELTSTATGVLVTNPPYGRRIGKADTLITLYQVLGKIIDQLPSSWNIAIAAADRRLALRTGIKLRSGFLVDSGGLKIRAMVRIHDE